MNPFANSPFNSDAYPNNPSSAVEQPDLCRICQRHEIEQIAEKIICDKYGPDEAGSMAAEVEKQKIIDSYSEACFSCQDDEQFLNDD